MQWILECGAPRLGSLPCVAVYGAQHEHFVVNAQRIQHQRKPIQKKKEGVFGHEETCPQGEDWRSSSLLVDSVSSVHLVCLTFCEEICVDTGQTGVTLISFDLRSRAQKKVLA